jgi:hypothetical protein
MGLVTKVLPDAEVLATDEKSNRRTNAATLHLIRKIVER